MTGEVIRELIGRSDFQQAVDLNERALAADPFRTELRVHRAFLQVVQGQKEAGMAELAQAGRTSTRTGPPRSSSAGWSTCRPSSRREALKEFEGYLAVTPPQNVPPQLRAGVAQLRQQVSGRPDPPDGSVRQLLAAPAGRHLRPRRNAGRLAEPTSPRR